MSMELGRVEGTVDGVRESVPSGLNLVSYYGGSAKGRMLWMKPEDDYIQLTRKQVAQLRGILDTWLQQEA